MKTTEGGEPDRLAGYSSFARAHPAMFANPSQGGFVILTGEEDIRQAETAQARRLARMGLPAEWAQVGIVYEDQYLLILRDAVRFPDDSIGTYIRIVPRYDEVLGVVVLPIAGPRVLLLSHFRHATRSWHLEIPRGFGMKGSSTTESARRELQEETGAVASQMVSLGLMHTNTGISSEYVELFYARIENVGDPEAHEAIAEILTVDTAEFEDLIREGRITDSFTITAYSRAKLRGLL